MVEEESCCVPPGFRFHPTEEELVGYYLARKVASQNIDLDIIQEVDLYRIEPWDLQERCKYGGGQEQEECWYFFSYKDRKYPSGTRTNRATAAGFWKATGRDKPVLSRSGGGRVIGMRKTLVFYKGRAPNGRKTDWIMHEYRLQSNDHHLLPTQEEGWVVCRAFRKPVPNHQRPSSLYHHHPSPSSYGATPIPGAGGYYVDGDHFLGSTSSLLYPQLYNNADHDLIESKNKHLLLSIPQLIHNSADDELIQGRGGGGGGGGGLQAAGAIDWNFLDTLLSSSMTPPPPQLHDPSSSSLQLQ